MAMDPACGNARKSLFTHEQGKCGRTRAIQEDLSKTKLDPIPKQEALDEGKGEYEREYARREEVRNAWAHSTPLMSKAQRPLSATHRKPSRMK